ncbi:MAG: zinc-binding dehydrogenase [Calditrichia bacterium]
MSTKMNALVLTDLKNLEFLKFQQVPIPQPKPGEVLVKINAAALNHRDLWIVKGLYAKIQLPVILGSDGAGTVVEVGEGVDDFWVGKEVIINPSLDWGEDPGAQQKSYRILGMPDNGTQAEFLTVAVPNVFPKPAHLSWEEAASIPLAGLTGYRALFTQGGLRAGETVLLTGIGGGVATLMMQMALASGAAVFVTSGSDSKLERAKSHGARGGVNYNNPDWPSQLQSLLSGNEVDLIVDSAGGEGFSALTGLIKPGGRIVFFGATTGNPSQINLRQIFWKQIRLQGTTMGTPREFYQMVRMLEILKIKPIMDTIYPFERFQEAYRRMENAEQFGKIILKW